MSYFDLSARSGGFHMDQIWLNYTWMPSTWYFHMPNRHLKKQPIMQGHHANSHLSRPKADEGWCLVQVLQKLSSRQCLFLLACRVAQKGLPYCSPRWATVKNPSNQEKSMGIRSAPHMPEIPPDVDKPGFCCWNVLFWSNYISCREAPTGSSNPFPFSPNCK